MSDYRLSLSPSIISLIDTIERIENNVGILDNTVLTNRKLI